MTWHDGIHCSLVIWGGGGVPESVFPSQNIFLFPKCLCWGLFLAGMRSLYKGMLSLSENCGYVKPFTTLWWLKPIYCKLYLTIWIWKFEHAYQEAFSFIRSTLYGVQRQSVSDIHGPLSEHHFCVLSEWVQQHCFLKGIQQANALWQVQVAVLFWSHNSKHSAPDSADEHLIYLSWSGNTIRSYIILPTLCFFLSILFLNVFFLDKVTNNHSLPWSLFNGKTERHEHVGSHLPKSV